MTPLNGNFSVSLANPNRPAAVPRPTPEFVVEVAPDDGFRGGIVQGLPVERDFIKAQPVVVEAEPEVIQAQFDHQSPCLLTPPTEEPPHDDGWFFSH